MTRESRPRPESARQLAFRVLTEVDQDGSYANLALNSALRGARLSEADAGLATTIVYGTLRWRGTIDAILEPFLGKGVAGTVPPILTALRMGAFQLLWLQTPAHAAVDTSVTIARRETGKGGAGLVNAVLRKVAALSSLDEALTATGLGDPRTPAELAARYSHPEWIVGELAEALGVGWDDEQLAELLAADNEGAEVTLVARPGAIGADELSAEIDEALGAGSAQPGRYSPLAVRMSTGASPGRVEAVRERRAAAQDEASQSICIALATAPIEGRDERWLDLCAGPGGKAALLQGLARANGAEVTSVEIHPHRAELTRQALQAFPGSIVVTADGRDPAQVRSAVAAESAPAGAGAESAQFDRVLVDAPCTGLGVLHRRAELRWRRERASVAPLVELQDALIDSAFELLRAGGILAYSTCTPAVPETDGVVAAFLARHPDAALVPAAPYFAPAYGLDPDSLTVRTWLHRHGTDSMFLALIRKLPASGD